MTDPAVQRALDTLVDQHTTIIQLLQELVQYSAPVSAYRAGDSFPQE